MTIISLMPTSVKTVLQAVRPALPLQHAQPAMMDSFWSLLPTPPALPALPTVRPVPVTPYAQSATQDTS